MSSGLPRLGPTMHCPWARTETPKAPSPIAGRQGFSAIAYATLRQRWLARKRAVKPYPPHRRPRGPGRGGGRIGPSSDGRPALGRGGVAHGQAWPLALAARPRSPVAAQGARQARAVARLPGHFDPCRCGGARLRARWAAGPSPGIGGRDGQTQIRRIDYWLLADLVCLNRHPVQRTRSERGGGVRDGVGATWRRLQPRRDDASGNALGAR
jgi:hypothetical protein